MKHSGTSLCSIYCHPKGLPGGSWGTARTMSWCRGGHCELSFLGLPPPWHECLRLPPAKVGCADPSSLLSLLWRRSCQKLRVTTKHLSLLGFVFLLSLSSGVYFGLFPPVRCVLCPMYFSLQLFLDMAYRVSGKLPQPGVCHRLQTCQA